MVYRLPVVSDEVNGKVEQGFRISADYGNILFKRYSRTNPVMLKAISMVPAAAEPYATFSILSAIRKIEDQAIVEGLELPVVTEETANMVNAIFHSYTQEDISELAMEFFNENKTMFKSTTGSITRIPEKHRKDVLYSTLLALSYLKMQGDLDAPTG